MDVDVPNRSAAEDGELEDGEICDDDTEERAPPRRGDGSRPRGGAPPRPRKPHKHPHGAPPHLGHPPPDFRHLMPYSLGPHGPFPAGHRQQCGPSGPDRPPSPPPSPQQPPGLGSHGEPGPRSSFWERSHGTLGRFRHRGMPNGGPGGWSRGGRGGNSRPPPGRYLPGESHSSPARKQKPLGRNRLRKAAHGAPRPESSGDESFEDLLSKYKQIQIELECIRKEETMALEPRTSPVRDDVVECVAAALTDAKAEPGPALSPAAAAEEASELERKKVFQAFNIKPLRQKLPTPADLDELQKKWAEPGGEGDQPITDNGAELEGKGAKEAEEGTRESGGEGEQRAGGGDPADERPRDPCITEEQEKPPPPCPSESSASSEDSPDKATEKVVVVEEEELSELQLRLLALQSASKKWQQKEQQVMRRSKERITKAAQEKSSGPGAALHARQRVTTRSASSAAATERSRTRSKPQDRDRERNKTGPRPQNRDRPKPSPKAGPKAPLERARTPGKAHITKKISPGSAAKQAFRKQQVRTWKLQQQREQEEKRRQEEEERRKREDEIRRIRDLSNQDEQYNRFMKLVGGRKRTCSKSKDRDHRKSAGKPGLDTSGNLYQYDNYDEVAMDTDSETGSPVPSPTHSNLLSVEEAACVPHLYGADPIPFGMEFSQPFLPPLLSAIPPPPPPLPPPPDELEPPPKPPFADEAEEEEMLLRETCLMSMANKRVVVSEKSSSAPPSPGGPPPADLQPPPRGNLSTVSLNTVPQPRPNKAARAHLIARAPLVLPRHKAVVVSLNDSDDSDSDMDACSSSQAVFGGLEFMIKEARRTVEAAKPKGASASEKENNPVRTPEALPDAKKAEYRLLKEEIASRERQRMMKEQSPRGSASPATADSDSSLKPTAELKLSEAELKLTKHRELLQRDEAMLRHLLQQELKKNESLKAAEAKVAKLREQLQASERIVSANKMLLRKLREQVHRVEQRVSVKKTVAVRLEQELLQAHLAAGRAPKRRADSSRPTLSKLPRRDAAPRGSERHFAELIAQKQRLQQLESEYALKIQKLKEAQALRNKGIPPELPVEPPSRPATPPEPQVQLPQPSLHDLSQDKLTLDSEDAAEAEDHEPEPVPAAVARGSRRSSFRQSSCSFTKPHLDAASSAPPKDIGTAAKPVKALPSSSAGVELPVEMFAGLDVDALKRLYQQKTPLRELLLLELQVLGEDVDPAAQVFPAEVETAVSSSSSSELRPLPFRPYHSPLLVFRSYRFSPYYRTKEKLSLSSVTYSNAIEAKKCFCRFDLTGTCNDDGCRWQHMRNCTLSGNQLFQDILSYDLSLIGCSDSSSDEDVCAATEKYMKRLFGSNKDRMGVDQKAVLLVSKVNESKRHVPPYTTYKDARRWRPKPSTQSDLSPEDDGSDDEGMAADHMTPGRDGSAHIVLSTLDACVTSEDKRYFISETDDIANLEVSVLESPRDTQLWIKLAFKYLNQSEISAAECLEAALNTLSRALESNCDNPEVWSHYLSLFSRRGSREEVQEMCEMAVEHAPDYRVWWNYLNLESSFEGKDYVCERLLQFLLAESSSGVMEKLSFQLMEALLYRVQLSLFTGRLESALAVLQNALKSPQDRSIADHLTAADRALLWLSYIHLTEFDRLPACLYDPAESGPSRVVSREPFLLPWRTPRDVRTPADILVAFFQDGVRQCSDEHASDSERTLACLPLHTNLIFLYKLLQRYSEGIALCESLLEFCPESCILRDALAGLHLHGGSGDRAVSMWLHALAECPHNAEVFYHCCKFLMAQEKAGAITPLFRGFVLSLCEDEQSPRTPVDVLRYILGFSSSSELLGGPVIKKELQERLRQQMSFLHLIHCRWQWLHGSVEDAAEAFERALGAVTQLEELHRLWMDYLMFSCSPQARAASQSRTFSDLVQRCLSTTPSRLELPFNPAEFWNCYRFHNKVVALYLSCLPPSQHALLLERLSYTMPNNTELGLRLLHQEWLDGNVEHLKFQARMLSGNVPKCLSSWKIAIAVEEELKERAEVRHMFQQALQNLPLSAALWKHRLLLEAAEGGASERLRRLWDCCQRAGVSVSGGVGPSLGEDG
ncbi:unnamed protein product [Oreochromis niloticus]|nr:unnamed protein product [Mustela putorius furo]